MYCITDDVEFRGMENKSFRGEANETVNMTVLRFDDESGQQNEFYVTDITKINGYNDLVRGNNYSLRLQIGKGNKVKLLGLA